jgi:hypothetical protein
LPSSFTAPLEPEQRAYVPFNKPINGVLRAGPVARGREDRPRFQTEGIALGPSLVDSLDNVEKVLAQIEGAGSSSAVGDGGENHAAASAKRGDQQAHQEAYRDRRGESPA